MPKRDVCLTNSGKTYKHFATCTSTKKHINALHSNVWYWVHHRHRVGLYITRSVFLFNDVMKVKFSLNTLNSCGD